MTNENDPNRGAIDADPSRPAGPDAHETPEAAPGASHPGGTVPPHIVEILCRFERKVRRAAEREEREAYRPLNGWD